jgi:hypothetical protein
MIPTMEILRIENVEVCGPHSLRLEFDNEVAKCVYVMPLLNGPVFQPLHDSAFFGRVILDPEAGTVVWPNGADLAPEALYALPAEDKPGSR